MIQQRTIEFSVWLPTVDLMVQLAVAWLAVGVFLWVLLLARMPVNPTASLKLLRRGATKICIYVWAFAPVLVIGLLVRLVRAGFLRNKGQGKERPSRGAGGP